MTARRTTGRASSTTTSTTLTSGSRPTSTSSPPISAPFRTPPYNTSGATLLFGAIDSIDDSDLVHRNPVESVGHDYDAHGRHPTPRAMFWIGILFVLVATVSRSGSAGRSSHCRSTTRSSTPRSAMRWCDCVTHRRRSPSTEGRSPNARVCGDCSHRSCQNYKRYIDRIDRVLRLELSMGQAQELIPYMLQFPTVLQRRNQSRRDQPNLCRRSASCWPDCRSSATSMTLRRLPGSDHPTPWPRRRQRRGQRARRR